MKHYDGPLFDCDNHYYEAEDAFMRHVPRRMQKRCVEWVEMNGKPLNDRPNVRDAYQLVNLDTMT